MGCNFLFPISLSDDRSAEFLSGAKFIVHFKPCFYPSYRYISDDDGNQETHKQNSFDLKTSKSSNILFKEMIRE